VNEFDQILLSIRNALKTLNQTHQRELAIFIEHYASEYGIYAKTNFQNIEIEVEDVKNIN